MTPREILKRRRHVQDSHFVERLEDGVDATAGLYLQILSNALRNGGTFNPMDTRIMTSEELVVQAYGEDLADSKRAEYMERLTHFSARL